MRTVILWVVLIVLFVGFYQLFSPTGGGARFPQELITYLPVICIVVFFIFFFGILIRQRGAYRCGTAGYEE